MPYSNLSPRTELEQRAAHDLEAALGPRGALVAHHGTPAAPAPASAPCDVSVDYGVASPRRSLMVEVARRSDASGFQWIVPHLDAWVSARAEPVNLLRSGRPTSARMARLVRDENERREATGQRGRIILVKLGHLEAFLTRWAGLPAAEVPPDALDDVFARWRDCTDDPAAASVIQECLFPTLNEKRCPRQRGRAAAGAGAGAAQEGHRGAGEQAPRALRDHRGPGPQAPHLPLLHGPGGGQARAALARDGRGLRALPRRHAPGGSGVGGVPRPERASPDGQGCPRPPGRGGGGHPLPIRAHRPVR